MSFFTPPRPAHVYVARLLPEHPLYQQARRLDQEIAALGRPWQAPTAPPVFLELGELFLPGPEPPRFPLDRFEQERRQWQLSLLPDRPVEATALAPDLAAELAWLRLLAEQAARTEMAQAAAGEDDRVARARAAAVRARQEALNNAGLDLSTRGREAGAAAQRIRDQLWAEIEQETSQARAAAEARLAEVRRRIAAEMEQQISAATADAWGRMQKRTATALNSGSETRSRMSKTLVPPQSLVLEPGAVWQPANGSSSARPPAPTQEHMRAADRRVRETQAARLAAARDRLEAQLYGTVALAALRYGGLHNWDLHLPPDEPALGPDLTEDMRPEIRRMLRAELPR